MSRAALWRQEANVKERERLALSTFQQALEEGKAKQHIKGYIPITQSDSFHLNPMLLQNISTSPYFIKICNKIKDWSALVDEIYYEVKHLEPWTQGTKTPSTAFSLLLRLLTLRCTEKQMQLMLDHVDSPYIRCIGFLYLRYAGDPSILWRYCQPYVYDQEHVVVSQNLQSKEITIGDYVRGILTDLEYYGTRFPRLPLAVERDIQEKLLAEKKVEDRALYNLADPMKMKYFDTIGSKVQALYGDEENPITWYDAIIDRVVRKDDETGIEYVRPRFKVTYTEYGNTEIVTLGEIAMPGPIVDLPINSNRINNDREIYGRKDPIDHQLRHSDSYHKHDGKWNLNNVHVHSEQRHYHSNRRSVPYSNDRVHDHGRGYAMNKGNEPRRDRSRSRDRPSTDLYDDRKGIVSSSHEKNSVLNLQGDEKPKQNTTEELAAIAEKKRRLAARYG